jgi:NAD(P)-dependent dehydrogenase (short-subunit alcohol dehydrogenase family)
MHVAGRVVVVTGGADGIGRALAERFHKAGKPPRWQAQRDAPECLVGCRRTPQALGATSQEPPVSTISKLVKIGVAATIRGTYEVENFFLSS